MSVLKDHTNAALMLYVTIPKDRTTVHVNLDILEMDALVKVNHNHFHFYNSAKVNTLFFLDETYKDEK